MFKLRKLAAAVAGATLMASFGTAQAVLIDPTGGSGAGGAYDVANFGWNNGNAISTPISVSGSGTVNDTKVGDTIQTYGHAKLQGLNDKDGNSISVGGFNPNSWSYIFGFGEVVTSANDSPTTSGRIFHALGSGTGTNFFEIWVGGAAANDLTGKGFGGDGGATLILRAEVLGYDPLTGDGQTSFDSSSASLGDLDQFGVNNYTGYKSVTGTGGGRLDAKVLVANSAYFLESLDLISVILVTDTFQNLPFLQVNPSSCFYDGSGYIEGAGNGITGGCGTAGDGGSISLLNGFNTDPSLGTNTMFQTRSTTVLPTSVPEPGALALVAMGLLGAGAFRRRSKV